MADVPLINGITYDYASIEIQIDGDIYQGVTAVNYDDTLEPGVARGTSPQWLGRTTGDYEATGSFTILKGSANQIRTQLGNGCMTKVFDVVINYAPDGNDLITDELIDCRISSMADGHAQGVDALFEDWNLSVRKVKRNGVDPLPNMF